MNDNAKNAAMILAMPTIVVLLVILTIPFSLFYAWAAQKLYGWFLLPIHGFPRLNLWHVYGITLLIGVYKDTSTSEKDAKWKNAAGNIAAKVFAVLILVGLGFLIKGLI